MSIKWLIIYLGSLLICGCVQTKEQARGLVLENATLIDGNGGAPRIHTDILIQGDTIAQLGSVKDARGYKVMDCKGKVVMPALISAHVHVGQLKGTTVSPSNYSRDNIIRQLIKYASYGVTLINVMGTDLPVLFESGWRDSSLHGLWPGARLYSAGYGFGPPGFNLGNLYQPETASLVAAQMDSLALLQPSLIKIWVDDFGGKGRKMDTSVYRAIIRQAHRHGLRVAAHVFYQKDAGRLIADSIDLFAHSIRDELLTDATVAAIKKQQIIYIPTLSLDYFAVAYASQPKWLENPFFKAALEPGVSEMIQGPDFRQKIKNSPDYLKNQQSLQIAMENLRKLHRAGVHIAMGTDSGARPIRVQGFAEHLELELMVKAGMTPLEAITAATKNAAVALQIDQRFGTIAPGKSADLLVIEGNPAENIKDTRNIVAVFKAGKRISDGPLR